MTTTYESTPPLSLHDAEEDRRATREWHALNAYITDGACREWVLCWDGDAAEPVLKNATAFDFRGHAAVITGGRAPRHSGSTGKVWTSDEGEYYPGVFDMKWVLVTK
jgi:hypothetical protein